MVLIMVLNSQITLIKVFIFNNLKRKYGGAVRLGSPSIRSLQNAQFIKRQASLIPQEWRHVHAESLLHFSVRVETLHEA